MKTKNQMNNVNFNKDQQVEAYNFKLNFNLKFGTLFKEHTIMLKSI